MPIDESNLLSFEHMGTQVLSVNDDTGCARGTAFWTTSVNSRSVFIAFDWIELRRGVPILTDPNGILTNLQFIAPSGHPVSELDHVVDVTRLVHRMDWQTEVIAATRKFRQGQAGEVRRVPRASKRVLGSAELRKVLHQVRDFAEVEGIFAAYLA
ncbi:MAG: hypothetical protein HC794_00815, partial [Nitrospiraceae bacterium]|nr:hypothetical protein [Nitrospiraceae bacterium]